MKGKSSSSPVHPELVEGLGEAGPAAEQPRRAQVHFAVAAPMTRLDVPSAPPGRPSRRHPLAPNDNRRYPPQGTGLSKEQTH